MNSTINTICSFCDKISNEYHPEWGGKKFWHAECLSLHNSANNTKNRSLTKILLDLENISEKEAKSRGWVGIGGNYVKKNIPLEIDAKVKKNLGIWGVDVGGLEEPEVLADADWERYFGIIGAPVKQSDDVALRERIKSSKPRRAQNIWLTKTEMILAMRFNSWCCFGCGRRYGTFIYVSGDYKKVSPVQMHVAKTRKAGGTKEDVRMGCGVCNKIHGLGDGMSDSDFKAMIAKAWAKRAYRGYDSVVGIDEAAA